MVSTSRVLAGLAGGGHDRQWYRIAHQIPWVSGGVLVLLVVLAVLGQRAAPYDPGQIELVSRLRPPVGFGGSWGHVLGTDLFGRDILSRVIVGARVTAVVSIVGVLVSAALGTLFGMAAGYAKSALADSLISRAADVTLAFPIVLLGLIFAVQRGPSAANVVVILVLMLWARFAKLVRAEVMSLRHLDFIQLAVVHGADWRWIFTRHLLPNVMGPLIVLTTYQLGWAVLTEASLSFLGAGVPASQASWGSMVSDGRDLITSGWWISAMPGLAIVIVVLTFNMFGDWLVERFDPHRRLA